MFCREDPVFTYEIKVSMSYDNGYTWDTARVLTPGTLGPDYVTAFWLEGETYVVIRQNGNAIVTEDGWETWEEVPTSLPAGMLSFASPTRVNGKLYLPTGDNGVYASEDGVTWTQVLVPNDYGAADDEIFLSSIVIPTGSV